MNRWNSERVPPIIAVVGRSGSGKTTLLERLLPELVERGYRVGTVKHHAHTGFEFDKPGKDSYRHKQAGAAVSAVSAPDKLAIVRSIGDEWGLRLIAERMMPDVDAVLTEGYSSTGVPRIVIATEEDDGDIFGGGRVLAVLKKERGLTVEVDCPVLSRDDVDEVAEIVGAFLDEAGNRG
ncbi:MAG: hypothetical protein MAG715_00892 [Methanonatronarchaeales archaeon]|nr:hypothetical protein [Methanonatronarchaeales archaeon]